MSALAVLRVRCLGEVHEVWVDGKRIRFLDHSARELRFMRRIGERPGCLEFLDSFAGMDFIGFEMAAKNPLFAGGSETDELVRLTRERMELRFNRLLRREKADPLSIPLERRAAMTLERAIARTVEAIGEKGLDAGDPVGLLSLGLETEDGFRSVAGAHLGGQRAVRVALNLHWYTSVYAKGLAIVRRRLVLRRKGDRLEVLWLPSETGRAPIEET